MRYLKMLSLTAVVVGAFLALAATASATSLTSPSGTTYTGTIKAESSNLQMQGSFGTYQCSGSTFEGTVEQHGASATVGFKLSALNFTGCNISLTVKNLGSMEVHTGGVEGNGTLTWTGLELAMHSPLGECIVTTNTTDLGTVTGSTTSKAVIDVSKALIPRTGGSAGFLCGSTMTWNATYTITTPSTLYVH